MNYSRGLILDPQDCLTSRIILAFLTTPLVLLLAVGAAVAM